MFEKSYRHLFVGLGDAFNCFPGLKTMISAGITDEQFCDLLEGESEEDVLCKICAVFFFSRELPTGAYRGGEIRLSGRTFVLDSQSLHVLYATWAQNSRSWRISVGCRDGSLRIPKATREALLADGWIATGCDERTEFPVAVEQNFYEELYRTASSTGRGSSTPPRIP